MRRTRIKGLIVAAGGSCGSFWPLARVQSRELLEAANRTLVEHAVEAMAAAGITTVGLAVSPTSESAVSAAIGDGSRYGVRVRYLRTRYDTTLLDALVAARRFIGGGRCLAIRGDVVVSGGLGTLVDAADDQDVDALVPVTRAEPGDAPAIEAESIARLMGARRDDAPAGRWSDAIVASAEFVAMLRAAGPGARLLDALDELLAGGGSARVQTLDGWARRVVSWNDLLDVNRMLLERIESDDQGTLRAESQVEGRVVIAPGAVLESTIVRGPAIIGAGAYLSHAYIGPYSAIGEAAQVEGSEIENSIVLSGAVIQHLGGRLESSIVGRDARVFRDFALPRALRLQVADGDQVSIG